MRDAARHPSSQPVDKPGCALGGNWVYRQAESRGIPSFFADMERYFGCKPRSYLVY